MKTSVDGESWTEIDQRMNNTDLKERPFISSFTVSKSAEGRFIRLTQTGKNHSGHDVLWIHAFEFFGTLLESPSLAAAEDDSDYEYSESGEEYSP
jgi:hypothetical protein